jgi:hypothetical protein
MPTRTGSPCVINMHNALRLAALNVVTVQGHVNDLGRD